jgi:hypothetical protein
MFKSSFAREILEETRHNADVASSLEAGILMPAVRHHSRFRSSFAASTHSVLDNLREDDSGGGGGVSEHDEEEEEEDGRNNLRTRYSSELRPYSVSSTSRFVHSHYCFR